VRVLGVNHLVRILQAGLPGLLAFARLLWLSLRVGALGVVKGLYAATIARLRQRRAPARAAEDDA
jgi:hypothetical protein